MDKKTQDLAWACLPKEVRDEIKRHYQSYSCNIYTQALFEDIFGNNLTSDTEPAEMLMIPRYKVVVRYEDNKDVANTTRNKDTQLLCEARMNLLANLFSDKCLPDIPDSSNPLYQVRYDEEHWTLLEAKYLEPYIEENKETMEEKEQPGQIFQIGERVHILNPVNGYDGKFGIIIGYSPYGKSYRLKDVFGEEGIWYSEAELELDFCNEYNSWILWNQLDDEAKANVVSQYEHGLTGYEDCKEKLGEGNLQLQYWEGWIEALINIFPEEELKRLYKERNPKRWRAEEGERYWVVDSVCEPVSYQETNAPFDNDCYEAGNYFRTEEEAQQAVEIVRETLEKFHEKNNKK